MESTHGRVYVVANGDLYYSPNCNRDFVLPGAGEDVRQPLKTGGLTLSQLQQPRWWMPATEWLGFIPRSPLSFTGLLFEVLGFIPRHMKFSETYGYTLPQRLISQWLAVDELLSRVTNELASKHSLQYCSPRPPYHFQYHKSHESPEKARSQAVLGRDWFVTWIGLLYWMICKIPDPDHREGITPPLWYIRTVQLRVGQAIFDSLRTAPLLSRNWTVDRIGCVLPFPSDCAQPRVSWFMAHGVPVWYRWSQVEVNALQKHPNFPLKPPLEWQLQEATTWISHAPALELQSNTFDISHEPALELQCDTLDTSHEPALELQCDTFDTPHEQAPEPQRGTLDVLYESAPQAQHDTLDLAVLERQAKEILQAFFQKRDETNAKRREKEKPSDRQTRENRERCPPTTSAPVYVWDWNHDVPPVYSRTRVLVADRFTTLQDYGSEQKRYDPYMNEWNCALELGPDDKSPIWDGGDYSINVGEGWNVDTENLEKTFLATNGSTDPATMAAAPVTDGDALDTQLLGILRSHFGFTPPLPLPNRVDSEGSAAQRKHLLTITGISGLTRESPLLNSVVATLATRFLHNFYRLPPVKPTADQWDLHRLNRLSITTSPRLSVVRIVKTTSGTTWYMFDFGNNSTAPWKLAVMHASVVMVVCRMDQSLQERGIALKLLEDGIAFRTLRTVGDVRSFPLEKPMPVSIPFRVATEAFTPIDFEFYQRQSAVLLNQRHTRAALLRGGYLHRIAKETLSFSDALDGPTAQYPKDRPMFKVFDRDGMEYIDDDLTTDEEDLLCGLYIVWTGHGKQQSKMSWFPLAATWEGSALCQNRWTAQDEEFYIRRVAGIKSGSESLNPLPLNKWCDRLRGYKEVRQAKIQLETWSRDEIHTYIDHTKSMLA